VFYSQSTITVISGREGNTNKNEIHEGEEKDTTSFYHRIKCRRIYFILYKDVMTAAVTTAIFSAAQQKS